MASTMMMFIILMLVPALCGAWWMFLGFYQGPHQHADLTPDWAQATFGLLVIVASVLVVIYVEANS